MSEQDPYTVLGVPPDATDKEIRNAYAARSKILHPDRFDRKKQPKEWAQAYEMHRELNRAYTTLRQAIQRSEQREQGIDAEAANGRGLSPSWTPDSTPTPSHPKRSFIARRAILGLVVISICGLCLGVPSLCRQFGIHVAAPATPPTQARNEEEGSTPSLEKLRQDAERGNAYAQHNLGHAYEIGYVAGFGDVPKDTVEAVKWYRKAGDQGHIEAQNILGAMYQAGNGVPKDAAEAVKWFRKAAEQGNAFAQNALGSMYETGEGVIKDAVEAVKWYSKAAETGDVLSQRDLGDIYKNGNGVPKDAVEAVKWYRKAAEDGRLQAQLELGQMYKTGDGIPKDFVEAAKWFRRAAERGDALAQLELGFMYYKGEGVPKDFVEAVKWNRKAAEQGNPSAQARLGVSYKFGQGVPKDTVEAARWFRMAAAHEEAIAQYCLGVLYENGDGVPKDATTAAKWYRMAAEQGVAIAQSKLGGMYGLGVGVAKDDEEAIKWNRKAAAQADAAAQYNLGVQYDKGEGVPKDAAEGVKWYRKAAEQGNADAQYNLGVMYARGEGVAKNATEAAKWYRKAAEQGNASAQYYLGFMYDSGEGVPKNAVEAVKWYRKAAEQGNASAQNSLGSMYAFGKGVTKNAAQAVKWYRKAAEQGVATAQANMGTVNMEGSGVPKDEIEALAWYYIAAASNYELVNHERTFLEKRLGPHVSLLAQRRSKEILKEIQAAKAKSARVAQSEQPGEADRQEVPKRGQSGTGVFVTTDGLILTAAHVVKGASSIEIQTSHGVKPGRLVKVDTQNDLALIRCEGKFQPAPVKASRDVKLGQAVFTIGFPNVELQGVSPKMTRGEISSLAGLQDDPLHWQISVPVQPGNSGGPLFDEAGNVIGVVVAKLNAIKAAKFTGDLSQNVNYAVKSAPALQLLAPYSEKLARERQVNPSDKVETVVEQCRESVVLIFGYGP